MWYNKKCNETADAYLHNNAKAGVIEIPLFPRYVNGPMDKNLRAAPESCP